MFVSIQFYLIFLLQSKMRAKCLHGRTKPLRLLLGIRFSTRPRNRCLPCSVAVIEFAARPGETYVVVGSASAMVLNPRSCNQGYLHTYRRIDDEVGNVRLELVHKTSVDDVPGAICEFQVFMIPLISITILKLPITFNE